METIILILEVAILIVLSAMYSGLNISLMSLRVDDLRRKAKLGNIEAKKVLPLREKIHLSLASILFGNVAVVSAVSLILEPQLKGLLAGLVSTILIVIFGEVLPQAVFSRFALKFCAKLVPFLYITIAVTYVFSKPIQYMLDALITKDDEKRLHSRAELGMIVGEHRTTESELDDDEVEIIQGALQLSEKTVGTIMVPVKNVYWLKNTATLDAKTVDEIKDRGYSRIPIFDAKLTRCFGVLLMKDMVDIDFDDKPQPVMTFPLHETEKIGSRTALDTMLRKFFALKSHLVPIEKDDKIVGVLTVEDLFEEIIGREIADETDHMLARE